MSTVQAVQPLESEYLFRAQLEGITPLLMSHPRGMEQPEEEQTGPKSRREKKHVSKEEEAGRALYSDSSGALYVPTSAIYGAILTAAGFFKDPDYKRRALTGAMTSAIYLPETEEFVLTRNGDPITEYEIDTRRAVNRTTRGAILVSRPKVPLPWQLGVEFAVDAEVVGPELLAAVLATAGKRVGIMAFRPEKRGPFGRFRVVDFGTVGFSDDR